MRALLAYLFESRRGNRGDRPPAQGPAAPAGTLNAKIRGNLLLHALLEPASTQSLALHEWNALLQLARFNNLAARLAAALEASGVLGGAPAKARQQLRAAAIAAESAQTAIRFEVNRVLRALQGLDVRIILMKGSAYVLAALPPARGRYVGDVDLMVPRERIEEVEKRLIERGWQASDLNEYDQRYYREWAHEIPPLQHPERDTPLDIHHTIVPLTSRLRPDAAALFAASVPLADPRLRVLCPADMVLHSGVHLFNDEVGAPLRDLFDLHDLLCHFGARAGFWDGLLARSRLHGLQRPLYYVLRHTERHLGTPIPPAVKKATAAEGPGSLLNVLMDWIFDRRFRVQSPGGPRVGIVLASWLHYMRAHWLRMPPGLLVHHLTVKAMRGIVQSIGRKHEDGAPH